MSKQCIHHSIYIFLLVGLFLNSCKGQQKTNILKDLNLSEPGPTVIKNFKAAALAPDFDTTLVSQYIRSIFQDSKGNLWFGTHGGVYRYDPSVHLPNPQAFTVFTPANGLNCCVQSMYQDKAGNMWWGAGQGLYRFDGQGFYQVKQNGPW